MKSFRIADVPHNRELPEFLRCASDFAYPIDCLKLLVGTSDVVCTSPNRTVKNRKNFLTLAPTNGRVSTKTLLELIFGENVNLADAEKIYDVIKTKNVKFFKTLLTELTHCVVHLNEKRYLESFLHFYRTLEKISIAFPLIYISSESDFIRANARLATFFEIEAGELKFLSKVAEVMANKSEILSDYQVTFSTKFSEIEKFRLLISEINRCCPNFIDPGIEIERGKFDIPFAKVPSFLISCRNRMFHFGNSGQQNIDIDRINGVSELCRMLTHGGLHWLALAYVDLWRDRLQRVDLK
jgi:hypothetical protein